MFSKRVSLKGLVLMFSKNIILFFRRSSAQIIFPMAHFQNIFLASWDRFIKWQLSLILKWLNLFKFWMNPDDRKIFLLFLMLRFIEYRLYLFILQNLSCWLLRYLSLVQKNLQNHFNFIKNLVYLSIFPLIIEQDPWHIQYLGNFDYTLSCN